MKQVQRGRSFLFALCFGLSAAGLSAAPIPSIACPATTSSAPQKSLEEFAQALNDAGTMKNAGKADQEEAALARALQALKGLERHTANAVIQQDFSLLVERHRFQKAHRLGTSPLEDLYGSAVNQTTSGLHEHLTEAIRSHEDRLPEYARLTDNRSTPLFRRIGFLQKLNLPVARYIDWRARRFQKQGISIISGDLVSMKGIAPLTRPPLHRHTLPVASYEALRTLLKGYQKQCLKDLLKTQFTSIAARTFDTLQAVKAYETREDCHLAMTCHMLESIGLFALHAVRYQEQSAGETTGLSRLYLTIQLFPLLECLATDRKAQDSHVMGVGVIFNDVPPIPFEEEWESSGLQTGKKKN